MKRTDFRKYLGRFEEEVMLSGVRKGVLGQLELVAVRDGRLTASSFGKIIGTTVGTDLVLALDYYGLIKKSAGFKAKIKKMKGKQVRLASAHVVHFASIKVEDVLDLSSALVGDFPKFKQEVLKARGFRRQGGRI